jgi:hypothetical protein
MFVEAKAEVWDQYARTFIDWLQRLRLIDLDNAGRVVPSHAEKEVISLELGNLSISGRGARPVGAPFVPSCAWSVAARIMEHAQNESIRSKTLTRSEEVAVDELRRFGALRSKNGEEHIASYSVEEFKDRVRELFGTWPYTRFWSLLQSGVRWADAIQIAFGFSDLAEYTRQRLGKKLANWGRQFGFLPRQRLAFYRNTEPNEELSLFD